MTAEIEMIAETEMVMEGEEVDQLLGLARITLQDRDHGPDQDPDRDKEGKRNEKGINVILKL